LALRDNGQHDEAATVLRKAVELNPKHAYCHYHLATVFLKTGRFLEARKCLQQCVALLSQTDTGRPVAVQQRDRCDRLIALEPRLADLLMGKAAPADSRECLDLAELCQLQTRFRAASRFCRDAFAADPSLADDRTTAHRYNAAWYAALAAAGQGVDAEKLDDEERRRLRQQALAWLRAELTLWAKSEDRVLVQQRLRWWQKDAALSGIRDTDAMQKLSTAEREACAALWADVAALLHKVSAPN
jgi:tetratricopeptide (TPR) repeat protein